MHNETISIDTHEGQEATKVNEDNIYAGIANEFDTTIVDKGLWTRLFAECSGDERQMKVLYIKQRAHNLISAEQSRLDQAAQERASALEQLRYLSDRPMTLLNKVSLNQGDEVCAMLDVEPTLITVTNSEGIRLCILRFVKGTRRWFIYYLKKVRCPMQKTFTTPLHWTWQTRLANSK